MKSLGMLVRELEAKKEYEAAFELERLAEANAELGGVIAELVDVLENILETGMPRNRQAAEKAISKAKGETE